ncbi:heme ABC transporter permease CcmC [Ampullimonas aquatilis]|uniref:heme ABC transporter permease CcmC n=1 Tax=Ampullimonas aquatilis TaxID=1341549 RepID=UPI003C77F875
MQLNIRNYPYKNEKLKQRIRWFKYAAPSVFFSLSGRLIPILYVVSFFLCTAGLYIGFFIAPTDHQQGEAYRIIFFHVPAAWMSMVIYLAMAFWAGIGLVTNVRLAAMLATASAPTGAMFTILALWTGALWGKPTWGTWWVWDARLTSELILLFLYLGFIALQSGVDDPRRADRAGAILALVGVVNVPIIYFSVKWWSTLHQGASVSVSNGSSMASTMLYGMLITTFGFWSYSIAIIFKRVRCIVLERERHTDWVKEMVLLET